MACRKDDAPQTAAYFAAHMSQEKRTQPPAADGGTRPSSATFWYFKRSCGSLEGSLGFHLGCHLRFHLGFYLGASFGGFI